METSDLQTSMGHKACNKTLICSRARGEHMRTHLMGDYISNSLDDEIVSNKPQHNNKHPYNLRAKTTPSVMDFDGDGDNDQGNGHGKKLSFSFGKMQKHNQDEDVAKCLVMLSNTNTNTNTSYFLTSHNDSEENNGKEMEKEIPFQCKACKKVFNSHQALGGHRASHKKVKGCFAAKLDIPSNNDHENINQDETDFPSKQDDQSPKVHECSVCHRVFSSGQALGGHKRCHWLTSSSDNAFFSHFQYDQVYKRPMLPNLGGQQQLDLNLNLPVISQQQWSDHQGQTLRSGAINTENKVEEVPRTKLKNLKDMKLDGGWLQMGLNPPTN